MTDPNELPAHEIGRRLRVARESANKRQEEAAVAVGLSRPTIVSIENGERYVGINELQTLTKFYGISVSAILRREAVHVNLIPRFRRLNESQSEAVTKAAQCLNDLVRAEVELENLLGIKRAKNYPPEQVINVENVKALAEQHAKELRDRLDIGSGPIADIFSLIEFKIGIRLFQTKLDSSISGLFVYDESVGACILLNVTHPIRRRVYSAAHELGHFIGTRHSPETLEKGERFASREEKYADSFARSFLAPTESFTEAFQKITQGSVTFTRKHVILLAHQFCISREFCIRRLEELGLVRKGTLDWFKKNGKITNQHVIEVLGEEYNKVDHAKAQAKKMVSHRIGLMATRAWEQNLVTEGVLSDLLGMHRVAVREVLNEHQLEEEAMDDILKLPTG